MPVKQLATRLTPRGWIILGAGAIAGILFIYLFVHMVSKPSYSTLATGLEPAQTGKMTSTLDQQGIGYELQNNGTALAVQSNETAQARVALAGAGVLGNTQPGFSLFEKSSLGESQFQQQVTYQRALQGQLEQTIDNIQGVSGAQVELVLPNPQNQLFGESQNASSAAVLLSGTSSLSSTSVRGIAQLVASSVPGLRLQKVTITDGTGQLLWPSQNGEAGGGASGKQAAEERYNDGMEASLDEMLAQTLGPGKAVVQVYANLNTNQTTQESLTYGKAGVPLQQSKNLETLTGSGGGGRRDGHRQHPRLRPDRDLRQVQLQARSDRLLARGGQDRHPLHRRPRRSRKRARLGAARPAPFPPPRSPRSRKPSPTPPASSPSAGTPISVAQMAFAKPTAHRRGRRLRGDARLRQVRPDRHRLGALPVLHHPRAAPPRAGGHRQRAPWLRELELPVRLSELEREIPPRPADHAPTLVAAARRAPAGGRRSDPPPGRAARRVQPRPRRPAAAQLDAGGLMHVIRALPLAQNEGYAGPKNKQTRRAIVRRA